MSGAFSGRHVAPSPPRTDMIVASIKIIGPPDFRDRISQARARSEPLSEKQPVNLDFICA
jgi:hypothetical protein